MASFELETIKTLSQFSNLKAYYRFTSGALTTDGSGNSHTLTAISDPAEDASGQFDGAVALDGNDAYSITDHADFKPTGNFTIGGWFKTSTTGVQQFIFQSKFQDGSKYGGIQLYIYSGNKLRAASGKNTGLTFHTDYDEITGGTTVTDGAWHFAVFTWDGSYLRLYLDGNSDATAVSWANAPAYNATNYVRVGCENGAGSNASFFTGSLDDVFLLNGTALTASEIKAIYEGYIINASAGSFTLTGINNILTIGHTLAAGLGSFTLTGIAAVLTKALNLIVSVGAFTLTGVAAVLTKALNIIVSAGAFTLTGIASALTLAHILVADVASFTLSGIDTAFKKTLNIAATVAEFTLTGIDNILYVSHIIVAEVADFIITGADTILTRAINLIASVGEFTLTGIRALISLNYETKIIGKISRGIDLYGKIKTINISGKIKQQEITGKIQHL